MRSQLLWLRPPIELRTERFVLRSMTRNQVSRATYHWSEREPVMAALQQPTTGWTRKKWRRRFARYDNRRRFCFGIHEKDGGPLLGYHTVEINSLRDVAFIGVVVGEQDWWGKGVVAETRARLLDYLFQDLGVARIWGTPFGRNFPSIYNYQRLGFTLEGALRGHCPGLNGARADMLAFGLLKEEWGAFKAGVEP